jgi:6-pyruvoyltetrahydropterin/6-carboxytetrahydropterin synthase
MKIYLTRRYRFSAAHRLHNEALSAEENARLYGKCNNPHGHGHNYVLDVTVAGPIDPQTGMVCDLARLDRAVRAEILERFDETNLNLDVENFRTRVPTTENICMEIFKLLRPHVEGDAGRSGVRLDEVRLEETNSNFIEYRPEPKGTEPGEEAN